MANRRTNHPTAVPTVWILEGEPGYEEAEFEEVNILGRPYATNNQGEENKEDHDQALRERQSRASVQRDDSGKET